MRNQSFYQLLVLFLTGACIFWSGCEPLETTCDDAYSSLGLSEYCSPPQLATFRGLNADETISGVLPNLCSTDYSQSRTVKIPVTGNGEISIHQFINFPGITVTEIFATDCENGFVTRLNDCQQSSKVVNVYNVEAANFSTIYVRVIYDATDGYVLDGESEEITIAAYNGEPEFEIFETIQTENGTERIFKNCDGTETNRLILSGPNALSAAIASGLPAKGCECSDNQLITISAPAGVDLNTLRPRVREKPAEPDTTNTFKDLILAIPVLDFANSGNDPSEDPSVTGNECLNFNAPTTGSSGGDDVVVTIVDSGIDINNHGEVFGVNSLQGTGPGCLEFGPYGTDLTDGDGTPNDETGHGTAVASAVISGYNGNRPLTVINNKFFNNDGGSLFNGLCAAYAGIEAGSHIINLSWGFQSVERPAAMETFLDHAKDKNVVIVASAGNRGEPLNAFPYWPALFGSDYGNMLTVASYESPVDLPPVRTSWTNYSPTNVQLAAFYARQCLQLGGGEWYPAGTSISAPMVTGQLAILKAVYFSDDAEQLVNRFLTNGLLSANASLDDATIGGTFLGRPDPDNNCAPFNEGF